MRAELQKLYIHKTLSYRRTNQTTPRLKLPNKYNIRIVQIDFSSMNKLTINVQQDYKQLQ